MKNITKIASIPSYTSKLRVAAYCRVSTESDAQLESLETQKSHYERYIASRDDWEFAGIYYDEGISGTKKENRLELLRLMDDCKAKKIDHIITKSISRFSRNTTDCLELIRKLLRLNVTVFFEKENINTGSMESELFLSVLSSMAQGESTSISDNIRWSVKQRFQNGTFKLSYPPYGYLWNGSNLSIDLKQANIIKRIFSDALSGKGAETIAKELNAQNIPSKKDGRWTSSTILGILSNEKYVGDAVFQKTYTDESFARHRNFGQQDMYLAAGHHPAIISHADFDAVQKLIAQRAAEKNIEKGSDKYQKRYAFSGKIICGECGNTFKRRVHSGAYKKYIAWCCNTHLSNISSCSMKYIRNDKLQVAFVTMLNKLIYSHKLVLRPYQRAIENNSRDEALGRIQHLENLLERNLEQRETLTRLMTQGYIDQVLYNRENNALLMQTDKYRADIEVINANMSGDVSKLSETVKLLRFTEQTDMLEIFNEELFTSFVDHIQVFSRSEIGFVLKCGLTLKERIGD